MRERYLGAFSRLSRCRITPPLIEGETEEVETVGAARIAGPGQMEVQHETPPAASGGAFLGGGPAPETARRVTLELRLSRDFAGSPARLLRAILGIQPSDLATVTSQAQRANVDHNGGHGKPVVRLLRSTG
jgi:hypothetical protein